MHLFARQRGRRHATEVGGIGPADDASHWTLVATTPFVASAPSTWTNKPFASPLFGQPMVMALLALLASTSPSRTLKVALPDTWPVMWPFNSASTSDSPTRSISISRSAAAHLHSPCRQQPAARAGAARTHHAVATLSRGDERRAEGQTHASKKAEPVSAGCLEVSVHGLLLSPDSRGLGTRCGAGCMAALNAQRFRDQ